MSTVESRRKDECGELILELNIYLNSKTNVFLLTAIETLAKPGRNKTDGSRPKV